MKVWLRWIESYLGDVKLDGTNAAELLTRAGIEVEGRSTRGDFSGVIVAEVRAKKPHPDASKLTLVDVWDGQSVTQVVCGAPNVPEPGHKVLWARPGAKVPMGEGGAHITLVSKAVRGIESPGMLCAEDELGLGESHAGILVIAPDDPLQPGDDVASRLGFPDELLELNVTPNRSDCLGHLGVARELAALLGVPLVEARGREVGKSGAVQVTLTDGCPRYAALIVDGVEVKQSPLDLRLRLLGLGVRPISNVVDITNALLMQLGQPTHAFDLDTLPGASVGVRRARAGEKLVTLDGTERVLEATDLVIIDGNDRAIALAGVMGGKETEVTSSTKRVLLEVASFDAASVRRTAKRLGLQSEASHRFERGVDPNGVTRVVQSAASMLGALASGKVTGFADEYPRNVDPTRLTLRAARTRRITGLVDLDVGKQADRLRSLDLDVTIDGDDLHVIVPTFRPDLTREIDLIEEVLRLEGYDRVPLTIPALRSAPPELKHRLADRVRDLFTALGFDEAITYAFVAPRELDALHLPPPRDRSLRLANPLREEQSAMRTSLVPGLVRAAARNVAHGVANVRLVEVGHTFVPRGEGLPEEHRHVAAIWLGARDGWLKGGEPADYFDLRGVVEEVARGLQLQLDVAPSAPGHSIPWLHPGVQGTLKVGDAIVGHLGELHPHVARALELHERALVVEISLSALPSASAPALRSGARFPAVTRDASFLIDADRSAADIGRAITALSIPLLVEAAPLEDYRDSQHVPPGKKSMLWSFTYRAADRTLTDAEVKTAHDKLVAALGSLGGALR